MTFPDTTIDRIAWDMALKEWHMSERDAATLSAIARRAQEIKEQLLRRADELEQELITLRAITGHA